MNIFIPPIGALILIMIFGRAPVFSKDKVEFFNSAFLKPENREFYISASGVFVEYDHPGDTPDGALTRALGDRQFKADLKGAHYTITIGSGAADLEIADGNERIAIRWDPNGTVIEATSEK